MFNSWDLLESGFVETLAKHLKNFRLLKLKQSSAFGAAKYAAKHGSGFELPIGETTDLLFAYSVTSTGYLANGHHVSRTNGSRTNGAAHLNGNERNGAHRQAGDEELEDRSIATKLFKNCSLI